MRLRLSMPSRSRAPECPPALSREPPGSLLPSSPAHPGSARSAQLFLLQRFPRRLRCGRDWLLMLLGPTCWRWWARGCHG